MTGSASQIEKTGYNGNWDKFDFVKVEDDRVEGQCAKLAEFWSVSPGTAFKISFIDIEIVSRLNSDLVYNL